MNDEFKIFDHKEEKNERIPKENKKTLSMVEIIEEEKEEAEM